MTSWVGALRLQAIITGIVCASAVALAAPCNSGRSGVATDPDPSPSRQTSRGGDLSRGIAFVLAPEWDTVYRNALRRIRDDVRAALSADEIRYDDLRISGGALRFRVREASSIEPAQRSIARAAQSWDLTPAASMPGLAVHAAFDGQFTLQLTAFGLASLHDGFIAASTQALKRRLSGSGFDDYLLTDDGERIRIEIPPMAGPAHAGRQC
jgi:preprotein translocase subunit SecD